MSSSLPERPDLRQLKRRARELHRAARAGDPDALSQLTRLSDHVSLATAQLAIARGHGYASWADLKEEVERRTRPLRGWPEVTMLGPGPSGGTTFLPDGIALAAAPISVARGTVEGTPFEVRAYETKPQPGAEWWDAEWPVGPEAEFLFGTGGSLGGGSMPAEVPEGHHLVITGRSFSSSPAVVVWPGCIADTVATVQLRMEGEDVRDVELIPAPAGFPRFVVAFRPGPPPARWSRSMRMVRSSSPRI
jgi:hypothetical protein